MPTQSLDMRGRMRGGMRDRQAWRMGCSKVYRNCLSQAWWHSSLMPALWQMEQEDSGFEASLGYLTHSHLKNK